jgi:hypothetical protein
MDDMDLLGETKVASQTETYDPALETLATEIGLTDDVGTEKTAGSLEGLYGEFFGGDDTFGTEKSAEEDKVASYQEALGARAHDYFGYYFDQAMDKIASEVLGPVAKMGKGNVHSDTRPEQSQPSNYAGQGGQAIDTTPEYTDEVKKLNDSRTVGHYESTPVSSQKTAAAVRKHMILSQLTR